ncbi:uncharacterized protein LOC117300833 [Asterias rubens]|uniref:uncharacterized protein LOC117300833 n=1 Tax=Asterias rubens TaxID=7604 RepID=UPI001455DBA3|nr:uncharacterized protein LOC117300833 [Asterias rubens]
MYCAFCQGVKLQDLIPWNLTKKECKDVSYDPISGSFVDVECEEVVYQFQPRRWTDDSVTLITLPRSCFPDVIESCPGGGLGAWAADLCGAYQAAINIDGVWYKNPHCVVCNNQWSNINPYCYAPRAVIGSTGSPISIPFDFPSLADHAFDSVSLILQCPIGFNFSLDTQTCIPSGGVSGLSCSVDVPVVNVEVSFSINETIIGNNTWLEAFLLLFVDALYLDHQAIEGVHEIQQDSQSNSFPALDHIIAFDIINISTVWTAFNSLTNQMASMGSMVADSIPGLMVLRVNLTETCSGNLSLNECSATSFDVDDVMFHVVDGTPYFYQNDTPALHLAEGIILHVVYTLQNDSFFHGGVSRQLLFCNMSTTLLCYHIKLSSPSQYIVQEGVIKFKVDGRVYESTEYLIFPDGSAQVCKDNFRDPWLAYSRPQEIINIVGTSISSLALVLTFVTYSVFPSLRTVPGKATMNFVVALFAAEILLLVGGYIPRDSTGVCTGMAVALHYIWLACFFWMTALGYDVSRTFSVRAGPRLTDSSSHALLWMCLFSWGTPLLALAACLPVHFISPSTPGVDFSYGRGGTCWIRPEMANLMAFGLPVMASLIVNCVLFINTIIGLRASKKITRFIERDKSAVQRARDEFFIYLKVSVLMGLTWVWFFLAGFTGATVLLYIATILNAFHGVFVFVAFVCTRRVWTMWRRKLDIGGRKATSTTTSTTNTISGKRGRCSDGAMTKTSSIGTAEGLASGSPSREGKKFNGTRL